MSSYTEQLCLLQVAVQTLPVLIAVQRLPVMIAVRGLQASAVMIAVRGLQASTDRCAWVAGFCSSCQVKITA